MKKAHSRLDESVRDLAMILAVMGRGVEPTPTAHLWGLSTVGAFSRKTNNLGAKQTK